MTTKDAVVGDISSNSRGSGARYNGGKARLDLIPLTMIAESFESSIAKIVFDTESEIPSYVLGLLTASGKFQETGDIQYIDHALYLGNIYWADCANVFEYGAKKYATWNWVKGMNWSVPLGCIGRHSLKVFEGELNDQESTLPHIGHIMCNLVMLKTFYHGYPEGNDLPPQNFTVKPTPLNCPYPPPMV